MVAEYPLPLVSIIIPSYNMSAPLKDALDSILAQTYVLWECIVVDDGSKDDTNEVVAAYAVGDHRIRYIAHEASQGPSAARNTGIHACEGEFVAFLDADDIWVEQKLERQVTSLLQNRNAVMSCTYFEEVDANLALSLSWDNIRVRNKHPDTITPESLIETFSECRVPGSASAALVQRDCLKLVGGFDSELRLGEDLELWYRIALYADIIIVPEVLVRIRRYPKEVNLERVLVDLGAMVRKIKSIAPHEHQALIARSNFDLHWGVAVEGLRRRQLALSCNTFFKIIIETPLRTLSTLTRKTIRWMRK